MRTLRYLPLCYLAGVHGFAFFAPYLALVLATLHFIRARKRATTADAAPSLDAELVPVAA